MKKISEFIRGFRAGLKGGLEGKSLDQVLQGLRTPDHRAYSITDGNCTYESDKPFSLDDVRRARS